MKAHKKEKNLTYICPPTSPQPHPWLLISHGRSRGRHIFYSISEDRYYPRSIPQLRNQNIQNSCHGWLILEDMDSGKFSLFNMMSMEVVRVIPVPNFEFSGCVLSSPPTDPDCRLVLFNSNPDIASSIIYFCKPSEDSFNMHDLGIDGSAFLRPTTFQGKIYGLVSKTAELAELDFAGPTPQATIVIDKIPKEQISPPFFPNANFHYSLVVFSGELFFVSEIYEGDITPSIDTILIFRADLFQKTWTKVKSIGEDCAIFLANAGDMCYLASTGSGIKGDTVYFTQDYDRCLYSFNLLDQSFSFRPPCSNVNRCSVDYCWITMDDVS